METVVFAVVFFMLYSLFYILKIVASKDEKIKDKPVVGDEFPAIEILAPEEPSAPVVERAAKSFVREKPGTGSKGTLGTASITVSKKQSEAPSPERRKNKIFGNRSEAKRAVIYSEIFNRKYE